MSTHNIGFYEELTKIIFELSSNTHLISSAEILLKDVHNLATFHLWMKILFHFQKQTLPEIAYLILLS